MVTYPKYALYGHHKCATMSLNTIAAAVCRRLGLNFRAVFNESHFSEDLQTFVNDEKVDFLSYGNADYDYVKGLGEHRGFHIIRDPRDIVASAYYSHMHSHSTASWTDLKPHREKLQGLSKDDGISEEIKFRARSFEHMKSWNYAQANILETRFESLASANYETLLQAFDFIGLLDNSDYRFPKRIGGLYREMTAAASSKMGWSLPVPGIDRKIPAAEFLSIAWRNRFQAKAQGREQGREDVGKHYRKGKSGDWVNHFTASHVEQFKQLYPNLVSQLRYADDENW